MRKWYELRGHAMQGKRIKMSKEDYFNGLLTELSIAVELEEDRKTKRVLLEEYNRLVVESSRYTIVKKNKKEDDENEDI